MSSSAISKTFFIFAITASSLLGIAIGLLAQNPQVSPSSSPQPTASPLPSPTRIPTPTPLPAAQNFHQWGSVTVFNGLPSDAVRAISQTPDGVMWFGTDNGLARFDGRRIQKFAFGGGEYSHINVLKAATNGELWIGTESGAFVYVDDRFRPVEGTSEIGISAILHDSETYLGTETGQVLRVRRDEGGNLVSENVLSEPLSLPDRTPVGVTSLCMMDGNLVAGTAGRGAFIIEGGNSSEFKIASRSEVVNSIAGGERGNVWLGSDAAKGISGIYRISGSRAERIVAPTAKVLTIEVNDDGVWAGTERYGLFHITESKLKKNYTFENTSGGLRSDTIFTIFTDREGVIWIGTNRGVSRFDRSGAFQQTVSDIPNSNFIRTLYRTELGQLYAGSNRGLFVQNGDDTWIGLPGLKNKSIYAIRKRVASSIVIGTPEGLFEVTGGKIFDGDVRCFAGFKGRDFAAIFGRGVVDINGSKPQLIYSKENVTSVFQGPDRLWIGTAGQGLFSYDGQKVKSEVSPEGLKSGTIWNMFQGDANGALYIAGQHGVFAIKDGSVEQLVGVEDVRDIIEAKGEVWAATTTRGLIHARHDDRFGWLVSSIGFEQGLPSEKAFSIKPIGDKLVIATNRGIVTYQPGSVAPKLIATRVLSQRTHDLAEIRSTIPLDYPQNSLVVEVAGQSSRTFPEEFQYAFTLTNGKGELVDTQLSNEPQYAPTNLAPGQYQIEAIAFNRDLMPSDPLTITFSVAKAPFPWTATALGILLAIAIVGLVWAIFEHRRIRQRNRELASARFDLANEAERERNRIARDLHDQTLADLRDLIMKSDRGSLTGPEIREEIESVSTEIRRICEDLSPSVLENVGLVPALEFLLSQSVASHTFSAEDGIDERFHFPMNVQLQIYRLAQEVLANIRQHSNADWVEMKVASNDGDFVLTIGDNGSAFEPNGSMGKGRGIANIRSRANLIGGVISWNGRKSGGNLFSLSITRK